MEPRRVKVRPFGGSLVVTLPAPMLRELNIIIGDTVIITVANNQMIIERETNAAQEER